jgi:cobalt-precorrin-5B (C1)-methyltransferase
VPDLRECGFGAFEYKNYEELKHDARYQAWIDSGGTLAFPDGESREAFIHRCASAFQEVCVEALQQNVSSAAFVVHGGTIMAVLDQFSEPHRDYFDWQVKNAEGFAGTVQMDAAGNLRITELCPLEKAAHENEDSELPVLTGIEDQFVVRQNKKLRCGYTTGSCAAAAAKAATWMLLSGRNCNQVELMTPKGILLHLPILDQKLEEQSAACAVRKFAGDDPDATDGILIYAKAEYLEPASKSEELAQPQIQIEGGIGVGRVTKPGLEQPVGAPAINRVPREMITREVTGICEQQGYTGGIRITISVPEGEEIAKKTFNPHIGILGGISILGTSGIVVPMSEEALLASIRLEMQQKYANGERYLLITPGNYGADFIRRQELSQHLDVEYSMKCSNYVGETVDMAVEMGFQGILFISHIGKFIKVSGGIMNTHSAHADCRAELMAAQTLRAGLAQPNVEPDLVYGTVNRLLETNTTEEAVAILRETGLLEAAMEEITKRIKFHLQKRCRGELQTEVILFSNQSGYLGESDGAEELLEIVAEQ